jgi:hypothetical protein
MQICRFTSIADLGDYTANSAVLYCKVPRTSWYKVWGTVGIKKPALLGLAWLAKLIT